MRAPSGRPAFSLKTASEPQHETESEQSKPGYRRSRPQLREGIESNVSVWCDRHLTAVTPAPDTCPRLNRGNGGQTQSEGPPQDDLPTAFKTSEATKNKTQRLSRRQRWGQSRRPQ